MAESHVACVSQPVRSVLHFWYAAPLQRWSVAAQAAMSHLPAMALQSAAEPQFGPSCQPLKFALQLWRTAPLQ